MLGLLACAGIDAALSGFARAVWRPGVGFDFDTSGRVLDIEMLDVSQRTGNPRDMALELLV